MGKLLKILTVFVFLFSIGVFVVGMLNFQKRELLIGRTHALEEKVIALALTLEESDPVFDGVSSHPEQDIDEVTNKPNDAPMTSDFWSTYNDSLEVVGTPTMNIGTQASRLQLRQYYFLENGKPKKNILGEYETSGAGTMNELLGRVLDRAKAQQTNLSKTREQLRVVREELEKVILNLNDEKKARRINLKTITDLEAKVVELTSQIDQLRSQIDQLNREKLELNDTISALRNDLNTAKEQLSSQEVEINRLKEEIKRLTADNTNFTQHESGTVTLSPGVKGKVVRVEPEWSFVIVELTEEAMKEIFGEDLSGDFVPVEMMVHRKDYNGVAGDVVTRVRITGVTRNGSNWAIADNLSGWEQAPVQVGDEVIY